MTVTDPTPPAAPYRFLQGNFAPVGEERTDTALEVEGAIPPALSGRYLRTGPNPVTVDEDDYHWFLGDGMVHGVRLADGRAEWYRNRWVRTEAACGALGEPFTMERDEGGLYEGMGNTNVVHHAGRIWALTEGALPIELGPELDTRRSSNFGGALPAGINAHPKFDPQTGEMHVLSYTFVPPFSYYQVVSADGRLVRQVEIGNGGPVMMHDMGLTASKVVVFDLPVVFNLELAMAGVRLPYRWDPSYTPRVGLLPRDAADGSATTWVELDDACYVYHPLNAYDLDDGRVVIDLVVHPRAFDDPERGDPSQGDPNLQRWTIDPGAGRVHREVIDGHGQEFPRGDERLATARHRFGWSGGFPDFDSIGAVGDRPVPVLKHDVVAGTTEEKVLGPGIVPGEMVFVPASPTSGEDEGWLVGYAYDKARGASDLVVLDANDWAAPPVATVHLPVRVPAGFHGNWVPDRALS